MGNKIGSIDYENNEGRARRIAMYKKFAQIDEDCQITEDMIDDYYLTKTSCYCNRSKDKIKAELLGLEWLGENWNEN